LQFMQSSRRTEHLELYFLNLTLAHFNNSIFFIFNHHVLNTPFFAYKILGRLIPFQLLNITLSYLITILLTNFRQSDVRTVKNLLDLRCPFTRNMLQTQTFISHRSLLRHKEPYNWNLCRRSRCETSSSSSVICQRTGPKPLPK